MAMTVLVLASGLAFLPERTAELLSNRTQKMDRSLASAYERGLKLNLMSNITVDKSGYLCPAGCGRSSIFFAREDRRSKASINSGSLRFFTACFTFS